MDLILIIKRFKVNGQEEEINTIGYTDDIVKWEGNEKKAHKPNCEVEGCD